MEVSVFARLHARPGQRDAVRQAILEVQGPTREEPGCLAFGAYHSVRDPDEFVIHSQWTNPAAFDRHVELPHTRLFVAAVEPWLDHHLTVSLAQRIS